MMMTNSAVVSCWFGGISPRATPKMSSAISRPGKESWMSAMRMISISVRPPT